MLRSLIHGAALLAVLTGCSDRPTEPEPGPPARAEILRGGDQPGEVAEPLPQPLTVRVTDEAGLPVPDVAIGWAGDGRVAGDTTTTDAKGITQNLWILGTEAGTQSLEVRWLGAPGGAPHVLATIEAQAEAGPAVAVTAIDHQGAFLGRSISLNGRVRARDRFDNELPDARIRFEIPQGLPSEARSVRATTPGVWRIPVRADTLTDTLFVSFVRDLRPYQWTIEYTCWAFPDWPVYTYTVQADSVTYSGETSAEANAWGIPVTFWSSPEVRLPAKVSLYQYGNYLQAVRTGDRPRIVEIDDDPLVYSSEGRQAAPLYDCPERYSMVRDIRFTGTRPD